MKHNIINEDLSYLIRLAQGLMVTHTKPVRISKEHGRELYGFIHIVKGWIEYHFLDDSPPIRFVARQTVFVSKNCQYICVYPQEETVVAILDFDLAPESAQFPSQAVTLLSAGAERLFRDFTNEHASINPLRCAAKIYELLDILLKNPPAIPKKYRRLQPAIAHMENNPACNAEVEFYAELCSMSPSGFRRSFREYVGFSPIDYRNNLRLNYARMLLASGEYSIEDAARQSGFNNIPFFYRLFRRKFGTSPGKF